MATKTARNTAERMIQSELIDYRFKAFPSEGSGTSLAAISEQQWNALDGRFSLPVMVLKERALNHNIDRMAAWCASRGVDLAPHAKTTMSPQLVHRQLDAGAWAITVANVSQARTLAAFGVERIIIANQVVTQSDLEWICRFRGEAESREIYVLADSVAGVRLMNQALAQMGDLERPLPTLLELGYLGGRAGCRTMADAKEVALAIHDSFNLDLAGVEGFEGLVPGDTEDARLGAVQAFLSDISSTVVELERAGLLPKNPLVTCGGSSYFDEVVREFIHEWQGPPIHVVLRSGCYVTHDHGLYARTSPLRSHIGPLVAAIEIWACVLSVPSPGLAIVGCGRRDVPYDAGLPIALKLMRNGIERMPVRLEVTALNDQHMFMSCSDADDLQVGDLVCLGVSHPCSAFDKWQLIPLVNDSYRVVSAIRTYF